MTTARITYKQVFEGCKGNEGGVIAWTNDGTFICAGGKGQGEIKLFEMPKAKTAEEIQNDADDQIQEPKMIQKVDPPSHPLSLAVHPEWTQICVGTKAGTAITFDLPSLDIENDSSILKDSMLEPNHIAYSPTGSLIGCACKDGNVVLVSTVIEDAPPKMCTPPHTDGPAVGICFDPENNYVFSVSSSGIGHVYDISDGTLVAEVPGLFMPIKLEDPDAGDDDEFAGVNLDSVVRPVWSHDGSFIAVPGGKEITIVERDKWQVAFRLGDKDHTKRAGVVTWCPNDLYLASCSLKDGVVILWDVKGKESVMKVVIPHAPVYGIDWCPTANTIAILCASGRYGLWKEVIPKTLAAPNKHAVSTAIASMSEAPADANTLAPSTQGSAIAVPSTGLAAPVDEPSASQSDANKKYDRKREAVQKRVRYADDETEEEYNNGTVARSAAALSFPEEVRQEPFQPTASPFNKKRRFLAFNHLGTLISKDQDSDLVLVIEPVDKEKFSRQVLVDHHRCTMGSLSENGVVTANAHFVIFHKHLQGSAPVSPDAIPSCDWIRQMPDNERVVGVAAMNTSVCVVTSRRFIRIFSPSGTQQGLLLVPGDHLCIAARGEQFVEAYYGPGGQLMYMCLAVNDLGTARVLHQGVLPISPGAELSWLGFSEYNALAALDTQRLVIMRLEGPSGAMWTPMLDFSPLCINEGEAPWLVDIAAQEAVWVLLEGGIVSPPTAPPPLPKFTYLVPPLIEEEFAVHILRHRLILDHRIATDAISDREMAQEQSKIEAYTIKAIKSMAASADPQREQKILTFCRTLTFKKSIEIAAKSLGDLGMHRLADAVINMADVTTMTAQEAEERSKRYALSYSSWSSSSSSSAISESQMSMKRFEPSTPSRTQGTPAKKSKW